MAPPDPNDAMVEHALAALRRLRDAEPSREAAEAALEELEVAWRRKPFTIGVVGDDAFARTDLLNALCGGGLFELEGRVPGCAPVRVRRGSSARFKATRRDGTSEADALPGARAPAPAPPTSEGRPEVEAVRAQVSEREMALLRAERAVPRLAREKPPWWAFWLWLIRWLVVRRAQPRFAAAQRARAQLAEAQQDLAAAQEGPTAVGGVPDGRDRVLSRLRMLASGMISGRDVQEIELEVTDGPLPDDVEVIELTGAAQATKVDVTVRVAISRVEVASGESSMRQDLGPPSQAARVLGRLPAEVRALWVARRAREVLNAQISQLDEAVMHVEIALRNRIARLENLRMPDVERFVPDQLERVRSQAAASINAVLEHGGAHLGSELAQRAAQWDGQLKAARTLDDLKALVTRIDEEGVAEYKRIAEETRMLVMGGVGGSARDLLIDVFSALRQPGLPDEHAAPPRAAPVLPPVSMLPSLKSPSASTFSSELHGAGQWLTGLFRSVDARRDEVREKVNQRSERVRAAAEAELLDAEPTLRAALLEVVGRELSAAVQRRVTWLAAELAKEQLAVDSERAALRPLAAVLEDARREARSLQEQMTSLEAPSAPPAAAAPGLA